MKILQSHPYGAYERPVAGLVSTEAPRVGAITTGSAITKDLLIAAAGAAIGYYGFGRTLKRAAIGGAIGLTAAILTG